MKKAAIILSLMAVSIMAHAERYAIVPQPAQYVEEAGYFAIPKNYTADKAKMVRDKSMAPEAYNLQVTPAGVTITAATDAGLFYGKQTLEQMLRQAENGQLAAASIADSPRFEYRGVMLDLVRCYLPVSEIKKFIDVAAKLKINNVHLHLTDDNGWRLEIKKYPKLTEVGAWRVDRPELFPGRLNARSADEPTTYGGYYTQKEMRELVKYAKQRHVNLIPEIEMPAHAAAAIASYPELACPTVDKFVGVFPGIGGKDASIIMCAGNDDVYKFYQDVLDEVIDIFPSQYIHLGGDEANKAEWEKCPRCKEKLEKEGLKDYEELQAYFMDRINHYVRQKGRTAIGWDEVTYGDPKEEMVIMGWQGDGGVAVRDAKKSGRKFIMTPAKTLYLIRYQGPQWFEPFTYFGNNTLLDVHSYEPTQPDWTPELKEQLQGVQGSMWTEFCREPADVQYMVLPRLLGVADVAWRPEGAANWQEFLSAVDNFTPVLDEKDMAYAKSMYNLDHKVRPNGNGTLQVELSNIRPDMEIRNLATGQSIDGPIVVKNDSKLSAATFADGQQMGKTLELKLNFNKATGHNVKTQTCRNGLVDVLTNGLRGSDRNSDFEWAGWHNDNADFVIDLGQSQPISSVTIGNLANGDICVAAPKAVYVYVSDNGNAYNLVKELSFADDVCFNHGGAKISDITADGLNAHGRYVKVVAVNPGAIPDGMAREGVPTWMYFDEVIVK